MAVYTTELRRLIENGFDLGLDDYPIFDEEYRAVLNKKIIDHYYFCEIGFETAGLFKFQLNTKMREIMPYYNKLYLSELLEFNPLRDFDETTEETRNRKANTEVEASATDSTTSSGSSSGTASSSDTTSSSAQSLAVNSDTPQAMLNTTSIQANEYASSAQKAQDSSTGTNTGSSTSENSYEDTKSGTGSSTQSTDSQVDDIITRHYFGYGKSKGPSQLLEEYRRTFLNIDMMIIKDLEDLFMMIY
jgi:hypothetical protein